MKNLLHLIATIWTCGLWLIPWMMILNKQNNKNSIKIKKLLLFVIWIAIACSLSVLDRYINHESGYDRLHPPIKYKHYKSRAGEVEISYYANGKVSGKFMALRGQGDTTWFYYDENKSLEVASKKLKVNLSALDKSLIKSKYSIFNTRIVGGRGGFPAYHKHGY